MATSAMCSGDDPHGVVRALGGRASQRPRSRWPGRRGRLQGPGGCSGWVCTGQGPRHHPSLTFFLLLQRSSVASLNADFRLWPCRYLAVWRSTTACSTVVRCQYWQACTCVPLQLLADSAALSAPPRPTFHPKTAAGAPDAAADASLNISAAQQPEGRPRQADRVPRSCSCSSRDGCSS